MSCQNYQELLALKISGDLPAIQARRLEAHLRECAACQALEESLREGRQAMIGLAAAEEPPPSIRGEVLSRIAGERRPAAWFPGGLVGAAAAALLVLALVLVQFLPGPETAPLSADAEPPVAAERPVTIPTTTPVTKDPAVGSLPAAVPEKGMENGEPMVQLAEAPAPRPPEALTAPPEIVVVKMLTDDPDVVIYMLVDEEEGDPRNA